MASYGIVDAAREDGLYDLIRAGEHVCLFAGALDPVVLRASPFIVTLEPRSPLAKVWDNEGAGRSWGIRCKSTAPISFMSRHFRHFLQARLPDGKVVLFRFYDPRVWRTYLPTCKEFELRQWFRNVDVFEAEAPDGRGVISYVLDDGKLGTTTVH